MFITYMQTHVHVGKYTNSPQDEQVYQTEY